MSPGPYSMLHQNEFMAKFIRRMTEKMKQRDHKYGYKPTNQKEIREHFVEEILEVFDLKPSDIIDLRRILTRCAINQGELIDVANLAWMLAFHMENGDQQ